VKTTDLQTIYKENFCVNILHESLKSSQTNKIFVKGLLGSLDAMVAAAVFLKQPKRNHIFILDDRESAAYFQTDLENILNRETLFFPLSYKRPYEFEEVDNANILQRTEVLERLNHKNSQGELIITYPDALSEKVINKQSLVKNSFAIKVSETVDVNFISEFLIEYGFEKKDFVYEAGEFSIRGGILDIFSFANDLPYRIELFGNEVESIRTFDPDNQLSVQEQKSISIIPDIQTKLLQEKRESILKFLPKNTCLWVKDLARTKEVISDYYRRSTQQVDVIKENSGHPDLVTDVSNLFINGKDFYDELKDFSVIEFGNKAVFKDNQTIHYKSQVQQSFNKEFGLIASHLAEKHLEDYKTIISCESLKQFNRLEFLVEEHEPTIQLDNVALGLRGGFIDEEEKLIIYTDHQLFERYYKYKSNQKYSRTKALTLKEIEELHPGDYVTHIDAGIGRFAGLCKQEIKGKEQEVVRIVFRDDDIMYVSIHSLHKISKYVGKEGTPPSLSKLGSPEWENKKKKVKKRVKALAFDLIKLYADRKQAKGFAYSPDSYLQTELETSFIYEDTPDQSKATIELKKDMESPNPMDRLICGDVGFGKTEIAIRAAFKAVADSKQVAVLVPTTILAMQHQKTFEERFKDFPCSIDYLNRFRTAKETKEVLAKLEKGEIDILIGTHKIVGKSVKFKDLGLLVIDEEQKFGVAVKEKIKTFKINVDVLTLTATPIPRTLQFSLMGARDLSILGTPPANRQPVTTELHSWNETLIRDAVRFELKRGGQVFFIHNRVNEIQSVANIILRLVPDARIGFVHGQMEGTKIEKAMAQFVNHDTDILVATNIIESGLDIPNANTIIINQSHMYGLSDLHQMRGRVGRSNKKAFCYMLTPSLAGLSSDARKRLSALEEFSGLGDGFKVAMRDLDIRGAGDVLGGDQSGFVNDVGYDTYHKILEDTVRELKRTTFKDLFQSELDLNLNLFSISCQFETDLEVAIPEEYVSNVSERLRLYNELDNIKKQEELDTFIQKTQDRFGTLPEVMQALIETVPLRWKAEALGFEKLALKKETLQGYVKVEGNDDYFQSEKFGSILQYIQKHPRSAQFREYKGKMIVTFQNVDSIERASRILKAVQ